MRIFFTRNAQDFAHPRQSRRLFAYRLAVGGKYGDIGRFRLKGRGATQDPGGSGIERKAVVFGNNQNLAHDNTPRAFSASTSCFTSLTFFPGGRLGGGPTFSVFKLLPTITPSACGVVVSIVTRLAFII